MHSLIHLTFELLVFSPRKYIFALPTEQHKLNIPIGNEILIEKRIDGENMQRPYSPVNLNEELGRLEIIVKVNKDTECESDSRAFNI